MEVDPEPPTLTPNIGLCINPKRLKATYSATKLLTSVIPKSLNPKREPTDLSEPYDPPPPPRSLIPLL